MKSIERRVVKLERKANSWPKHIQELERRYARLRNKGKRLDAAVEVVAAKLRHMVGEAAWKQWESAGCTQAGFTKMLRDWAAEKPSG